jgi:hypothetical protein
MSFYRGVFDIMPFGVGDVVDEDGAGYDAAAAGPLILNLRY